MEGNTTVEVKMEDIDAEKVKVFVKEELLHASTEELLQASKDELLQDSKEELYQEEEEEDADNLFVQTGDVKVEISETNGKFYLFVFQNIN